MKLRSLEALLVGICRKLDIDETTIEGYVPVLSARPSPVPSIPSATSSLGHQFAAVGVARERRPSSRSVQEIGEITFL